MYVYTKQSLDGLKQKVDLLDVLSSHVDLKRQGASYKGLCPFHEERTPSFIVQRGESHYHCFGCGAHGDSITFLMEYLKMSFVDAIEYLAEKFHVPLEKEETDAKEPSYNRTLLKEILEQATRFYEFHLLHTEEGKEALRYLFRRDLGLDFIKRFRLGLAPKTGGVFRAFMESKRFNEEDLALVGLLNEGKTREFFSQRILFPIQDAAGAVIGFSGRKFHEEVFGGKYVNTPETPLFKKNRVLFGLNYCRRKIAKERQVIVVEGQIDALRLIYEGFDTTVAGQGTAFGQGHVQELVQLGVNKAYLALDGDEAGRTAAEKIGNMFQSRGIEVQVVLLPSGSDPDSLLRKEGKEAFAGRLVASSDYLSFLVQEKSKNLPMHSPAAKAELVKEVSKQIRDWESPVMVHESLKKLAHLTSVPEEMVGMGIRGGGQIYLKKVGSLGTETVDPDAILEGDLLRWTLLPGDGQACFQILQQNMTPEEFRYPACRMIYAALLAGHRDLLSLAIELRDPAAHYFLMELMKKKVKKERAKECFLETLQKVLDRNWMQEREEIRLRIQSGRCSEDEVLSLVKQFDAKKSTPPRIQGDLS